MTEGFNTIKYVQTFHILINPSPGGQGGIQTGGSQSALLIIFRTEFLQNAANNSSIKHNMKTLTLIYYLRDDSWLVWIITFPRWTHIHSM